MFLFKKTKNKRKLYAYGAKVEVFEVGKTLIRIELEDGTVLHKDITGTAHMIPPDTGGIVKIDNEYWYKSIYVYTKTISDSISEAKKYMKHLKSVNSLYDSENSSVVYYSLPVKSEIVSTQPFSVQCPVYYKIEKEFELKNEKRF